MHPDIRALRDLWTPAHEKVSHFAIMEWQRALDRGAVAQLFMAIDTLTDALAVAHAREQESVAASVRQLADLRVSHDREVERLHDAATIARDVANLEIAHLREALREAQACPTPS